MLLAPFCPRRACAAHAYNSPMTVRQRNGVLAVCLLALTGCATSGLPPEIREPPVPDVSVAQVQAAPAQYAGQAVRWGGTVLEVRNLPQVTEIEILARLLADRGAPRTDGVGQGRFVAQVPGFLDPAEYPRDRRITVAGTVTGVETRKVGDYPYRYPIVRVKSQRLWADPVPDPYWHHYPYYDPWFYPWGWRYPYPWHPWYPGWPHYW